MLVVHRAFRELDKLLKKFSVLHLNFCVLLLLGTLHSNVPRLWKLARRSPCVDRALHVAQALQVPILLALDLCLELLAVDVLWIEHDQRHSLPELESAGNREC